MKVKLIQSRDIKDYSSILEGLTNVFEYDYWHAILCWCKIIETTQKDNKFWEVWIIKHKNKTIGICGLYSLYEHSTEELWLGWFGILEEYRDKGLGKLALDDMIKKAKNLKCKTLCTYVDKDKKPVPFYERNGFKVICRVNKYVKKHKLSMYDFSGKKDFVLKNKLQYD